LPGKDEKRSTHVRRSNLKKPVARPRDSSDGTRSSEGIRTLILGDKVFAGGVRGPVKGGQL